MLQALACVSSLLLDNAVVVYVDAANPQTKPVFELLATSYEELGFKDVAHQSSVDHMLRAAAHEGMCSLVFVDEAHHIYSWESSPGRLDPTWENVHELITSHTFGSAFFSDSSFILPAMVRGETNHLSDFPKRPELNHTKMRIRYMGSVSVNE